MSACLLSLDDFEEKLEGPTEMRGSLAHKGITARSRAKPVALKKGEGKREGGSDGRRTVETERKALEWRQSGTNTAYGEREGDMCGRTPRGEMLRSESKKVSKELSASFTYCRALYGRCFAWADHVLAYTVKRVNGSPLLS